MENKTYNGWTNYETWNIALWIQNDQELYQLAKDFINMCKSYKWVISYTLFLRSSKLNGTVTKDGIPFDSRKLNRRGLSRMLKELLD